MHCGRIGDGHSKRRAGNLIKQSYARRPIVIRNCHDSRLVDGPAEDIRERLGLDKECFLIVVIGNHKRGQRFDSLFAALGEIDKSVHVQLIGRGYEVLTKEIEAAGLSGRVYFAGALPPWSIAPSVRSADLAALPYYGRSENYSFSLPNGFFQSVGAALRLLYPDLPEIRVLAERYDMGLIVNWASAEDIAAKITLLRDSPDVAMRLHQHAMTASEELSWQREEEPWLKIISGVITSNTTPEKAA